MENCCCRVKNMVGIDSASMYDTQWQMSNRCRKCHGQGRVLCRQETFLGKAMMIRHANHMKS